MLSRLDLSLLFYSDLYTFGADLPITLKRKNCPVIFYWQWYVKRRTKKTEQEPIRKIS